MHALLALGCGEWSRVDDAATRASASLVVNTQLRKASSREYVLRYRAARPFLPSALVRALVYGGVMRRCPGCCGRVVLLCVNVCARVCVCVFSAGATVGTPAVRKRDAGRRDHRHVCVRERAVDWACTTNTTRHC